MNEWILYDISDRKMSRNGNDEYFILSFFNTQTKVKAQTYITVGYRNNDWWGKVIVDDLYGVYQFKSFKTKQSGTKLLIDGDSRPDLINQTTYAEANAIVDIMSGVQTSVELSGQSL